MAVILPKKPTAGPLLDRAKVALQIDLVSVATRDLQRAAKMPKNDPCVPVARQELDKLRGQAADEIAQIKRKVEQICAKPLVDCKAGKKPGTFCSHDVTEQVADLKCLARAYVGFPEVQRVNGLLTRLQALPGYQQGNKRAMQMAQIDMAKTEILSGKYWDAYRALRKAKTKSKDEYIKELSEAEMGYLASDPKVGGIIKMNLKAEAFAKKQAEEQTQMLEVARNKRQSDPAAARKSYEDLIDKYPLSAAARLAKAELAELLAQ